MVVNVIIIGIHGRPVILLLGRMGTGSRVLKNPDSARFRSGFGKLHVKCYPDDLKSHKWYNVTNSLMLLAWASRTPKCRNFGKVVGLGLIFTFNY